MRSEVSVRRCADTVHHIVTLCCQNSGRNPGGNLPAQTHITSATWMCATAIYQPPKTLTSPKRGDFSAFLLLQLLTQIFFNSSSDLPHLSQVRVTFHELWSNIVWRMLALVASSPLPCVFWDLWVSLEWASLQSTSPLTPKLLQDSFPGGTRWQRPQHSPLQCCRVKEHSS